MRISDGQMRNFEAEQRRRYVRGIMDVLRRDIGPRVAGMPDEVLERRVIYGIGRAGKFGLDSAVADDSRAIVLWVRLMFEAGPDFDEHPAVAAALSDVGAPPASRVLSLLRVSLGIPWEDVAKASHPEQWPK